MWPVARIAAGLSYSGTLVQIGSVGFLGADRAGRVPGGYSPPSDIQLRILKRHYPDLMVAWLAASGDANWSRMGRPFGRSRTLAERETKDRIWGDWELSGSSK